MAHEGGCLCGAVRFRAEDEPLNVRMCHCRLCQKTMGSPFFARALFPLAAVTLSGPTGAYATSPNLDRVFCQACGCRIGSLRKDGSGFGLALAQFDDRNAFAPAEHIWVSEKMAWLNIDDGLPQWPERPPV